MKVTPEHGLIIKDGTNMLTTIFAREIQLGDKIMDRNRKIVEVKSIQKLTPGEKYTLITSHGTVLASDLFVATLCEEEIKTSELALEVNIEN